MHLVDLAQDFVAKLKEKAKEKGKVWPLYRLEPNYVMVEFIASLGEGTGYYLGRDRDDGDNSDNGHHEIKLG